MKVSLVAAVYASVVAGHALDFTKDKPTQIDDAGGATYKGVEECNHIVRPIVEELVKTDYFRYYKVDLSEENCPFVDDGGMCGNRACAVDPVADESELPEFWRTQYLGKLEQNSVHALSGEVQDGEAESCIRERFLSQSLDVNYCYPEDESINGPGVYVSLVDNPERFTGYAGSHANKVWRAVYQENCFGYQGNDQLHHQAVAALNEQVAPEETDSADVSTAETGAPVFGGSELDVFNAPNAYEKREVGGELGQEAMNTEEFCVEQRLFYRLLSGMHASVSTHICTEYLNKTTGEWGPNPECFMSRVGNYPERVSNMYFNYALVARAVAKLENYMDSMSFCGTDFGRDRSTRRQLSLLARSACQGEGKGAFNETQVFATAEAAALKGEFRRRVRNVNALMSCVGCDRCRLWGKLQTAGYGTALKILFELPDSPESEPETTKSIISGFQRSELVALVNTFDRLSKSVEALEKYRNQLDDHEYNANTSKTRREWDSEWALAWTGIKFILNSYIEFPRNMWTLIVFYSARYWNWFIGRDDILNYEYVLKSEL